MKIDLPEQAKVRVLLVEDSVAQAKIARLALQGRGLEVDCASTLSEALSRLNKPGIDAILLDLSLPDSNGIETFYKVSSAKPDVPIVILSGHDSQDVALEALKHGAQDYLIKGHASDDSIARCLRYAVERFYAELALRRGEKRVRIILENSYDAFISMDSKWNIIEWNIQAERTFGTTRAEALGQKFSSIAPHHLRKQYARDVAAYFKEHQSKVSRMNGEMTAIHKDGHEFPIEIVIFRIKDDADCMYCAFVRDISERKHAAEKLEQRVQERTAALTRSNEELKQFAKIASHDLQEPLRAVEGFANLLAESTKGKLDADCNEFIEYILDGTRRMRQLIEGVLVHSNIQGDDSEPLSTDCNSVLEEVLANLNISIRECGAHLEIDNLPHTLVERWQLVQLFQNLISNALKYRSIENPQITIKAERTVNEWLFSVSDNGIGIEPKYAEKIFDIFARLHRKNEYSGTGMGLAICKKIVTTHGGRIWVESEPGRGSVFLFTLPAADKPTIGRKAMDSNIEILLVEDSPSDVRLTQEALKRCDLKTTMSVVNDGVEAMDYLHQAKESAQKLPDIILLDLNMPRKNGHEVLAEIQADPQLTKIPVVLLTVSQRDEDVMEALKLKMNYYLAKPVTSERLSTLIKSIYELQSEEQGTEHPHSNEETHVRMILAGNPHTPASILTKLAHDENARVRSRVAENPQTPGEVLSELVTDSDPDVRLSVSENPKAPIALLERLARDANADVRLGIAGYDKLPARILSELENDENTFVAAAAKNTMTKLGSDR